MSAPWGGVAMLFQNHWNHALVQAVEIIAMLAINSALLVFFSEKFPASGRRSHWTERGDDNIFYVWSLGCACSFYGCKWAYCHGTLLCEVSLPQTSFEAKKGLR